jgi:hypothetical protein
MRLRGWENGERRCPMVDIVLCGQIFRGSWTSRRLDVRGDRVIGNMLTIRVCLDAHVRSRI